MKTHLQLVAVSRENASELMSVDDLYATLTKYLLGLEITSGILLGSGPIHNESESAGPAFTVYHAEATYKGSLQKLREEIKDINIAVLGGFDINVAPLSLQNEDKKLLVMDVDSTLIRQEVIDELADFAGRSAEVAAVTERAMRGELDFEASLRERVKALAGLPASVLSEVHERIFLTPGAQRLVKLFLDKGHAVAVVSGGFVQVLKPLAGKLDLSFARANFLEVKDGVLTGQVLGEIIDGSAKQTSLKEWAKEEKVSSKQIIAVGDGANDILMLEEAELGIAFNAKPALAEVADARINTMRLDIVRYFVGL